MQRNTLFSFLTIAALGLLTAGQANAETYTWVGGAGTGSQQTQWDYENSGNYENWSWGAGGNVTSLPASGDTVVIPDVTYDPIIDSGASPVTFTTLTINRNGELTVIDANTILTLDGSSHTLNGNLVLQDNDTFVKFTYPQSSGWIFLTGGGGIVGENEGAEVQLANAKIDSDVNIEGKMIVMQFSGTSTFKNGSSGVVLANVDGTLLFADELDIDDVSGASWQAKTDPGALLKFSSDDPDFCIKGNFLVDNCATIELAAGVVIETQGSFTQTAGTLTLGSGATFAKSCNSGCTSCTSVSAGTVGCS